MQALEPITTADARAFLGLNMNSTDEDALLTLLISGARAAAENYLRRHIAQQDVTVSTEARRVLQMPDTILVLSSVTVATEDGTEDITTSCTISGDTVTLPYRTGLVTVQYVPDMYCPPEVRNALLMMVRNSYTDRSANPLTEDVKQMLAPSRRLRI